MATPKIDAYFEQQRGYGIYTPKEDHARHIGETPELLRERLKDALSVYRAQYPNELRKVRYDLDKKRIIGGDGLVIQWRLREFPDLPESYENQQTNTGLCLLRYDFELDS